MARIHKSHRGAARGFSLIEVLIAVVVLSVGLLALGALQAALVRNSSETKARSGALALAEEQLEDVRDFLQRGDYEALGDVVDEDPNNDDAALGTASGGVDYSRNVTVRRWALNRDLDPPAFEEVETITGSLGAPYIAGREFKRVEVEVTWTDAQGGERSVTVSDIVSAASPQEAAQVLRPRSVGNTRPRVLITNPALEEGVIPVAIGNNTDTAATNPRPEVAGRNNNQRVIETRFDVLTYRGGANDLAEVQARVETVIVGCTCSATTSSSTGFRPAYWDGSRYTRPVSTGSNAPAQHASLGNNDPPESPLCTECCRDHHDTGFSGAKFSPRRGSHTHNIVGGVYQEACRMIRVDGIMHTAADMYNDYFNLLETANTSADPVPSDAAAGNYEDFVLDYLGGRMVTGTGYNTLPIASVVSGYEAAHNINAPAEIQIERHGSVKWLHGRGLYIDYLEDAAINRINDAKSDCDTGSTTLATCVLRHVPFTSINLTELANWTPASGNAIVVTNNDFASSIDSSDPVRGRVESVDASPGSDQTATGAIWNSNAGLALMFDQINDEAELSDSQLFKVTGSNPPPGGGSTGTFTMSYTGYPTGNSANKIPAFTFVPPGTGNVCNHATSGGQRPNPYTCSTTRIGTTVDMLAGNYNFSDTASYTLSCTDTSGSNAESCTKSFPVCRDYELASVSGGTVGAVSNEGKGNETTAFSLPSLAASASISLTFSLQDTIQATTCTYTSGNNTQQRCNNAVVPDPCL